MSDDGVNKSRRMILTGLTSTVSAVGVGYAAVPFVKSWEPSAKARAAGAPVSANIGAIAPGEMITVEWRGKPVYIVRRNQAELENLVEGRRYLSDPDSAQEQQPGYVTGDARAVAGHEEFVILIGLCTHLGCAPTHRPEVGAEDLGGESWLGGFFCPCHGSKFDLSGRVYAGVPAPLNLEVPPYRFESDSVIVIGEDQETA
ncbi:MAG: ubiquinol-cytochrome c reductase iron-sulfur subunit [Porticoccaceae bacterium]|jgi:ubiquinol-cytochrome c reductase iron-sulfur subunit|nr:ubiquinol-cytochrome c reductase iron-sulfur subunit [Porticoccaceae bacterium]